jgi:hypothetical protein
MHRTKMFEKTRRLGRSGQRVVDGGNVAAVGVTQLVALVVFVSSCGSKSISTPQNSGFGGTTGASSPAQCAAGDTRLCVGPGACSGAQACDDDSHWSSCNCGSAGQTAGSSNGGSLGAFGGAATGGEAAGSTEHEGGSPGNGAGAPGTGGAEPGAAGSGMSGDEDCPDGTLPVDCSKQCDTSTPSCSNECGTTAMVLDSVPLGSTLIRLPSHPGSHCNCSADSPAAYSVGVSWHNTPTGTYHVSVSAPWSFNPGGFESGCALPFISSCQTMGSNVHGVLVQTSDPDAPAANVTIEAGRCPCTSEPCP